MNQRKSFSNASASRLSAAKILIVDDDSDARYSLDRRLRQLGYDNISSEASGEAALAAIEQSLPDLILLDIMMPGISGLEVLERLANKRLLERIPVLVISAGDSIDHAVRAIDLGAEDYLTKPVNKTLIAARVRTALEKKRLRDDTRRQLRLIREVFGRYVPDEVIDTLLDQEGGLAPLQTEATILYTDIAGFTRIVENLSASDVTTMLNDYFSAMIEPIVAHGGTVNQFQGDAMLVTYNVPVAVEDHAERAVRTAMHLRDIATHNRFNGQLLRTRIGVNTGLVTAGNVGSGARMNYTVHGHAVNIAARLESMNKSCGTDVLISQSTVDQLPIDGTQMHVPAHVGKRKEDRRKDDAGYSLTPVGKVQLAGVSDEIDVYTLR